MDNSGRQFEVPILGLVLRHIPVFRIVFPVKAWMSEKLCVLNLFFNRKSENAIGAMFKSKYQCLRSPLRSFEAPPRLDPSAEVSEGLTETGSVEGGSGPEKYDKRTIQRRPRTARITPTIDQPKTG